MPKFLEVTDIPAAKGVLNVNEVSVVDHGATGDGITDDTAAIHAARDAAGSGGIVIFPTGTYKVLGNNDGTGGLQANVSGQTWRITAGASIVQHNNARALITVSASGVTLEGGGTLNGGRDTIGDNASNVLAIVMGTKDSADLTVKNLSLIKSSHFGVWAQASRSRVLRCRLSEIWSVSLMMSSYYLAVQIGSTMQETFDMEVSDNFIDRSDEAADEATYPAIQMRGNAGSASPGDTELFTYRPKAVRNTILLARNPDEATGRVQGIEIARAYHGLAQGNRVVNGAMGISFARNYYGQSIGNTLIGSSLFAQELSDSPGCVVYGNVIDGDGIGGVKSSGSGITAQGSSGLSNDATITGNRLFNMDDNCRAISAGSVSGWNIAGNTIEASYGMALTSVSDFAITGNTILGDDTGAGITLVNCDSGVVSANTVRDYSAAVLVSATSGTSDYFTITGNHFRSCTATVDGLTSGGGTIGTNIINASNIVRA